MADYKKLYLHFLDQLKDEISLYRNDDDIWKLTGKITNTPGNLCLHLCGNLNHFIGAVLENTGYIRDRDKEFSQKNVSREDLLNEINNTKDMVEKVFDKSTSDNFNDIYPVNSFGENVTIGYIVSLLVAHLAYHVGQINYHRRIVES